MDNSSSEGSPPVSPGLVFDLKKKLAGTQQQLEQLELHNKQLEAAQATCRARWEMPVLVKVCQTTAAMARWQQGIVILMTADGKIAAGSRHNDNCW